MVTAKSGFRWRNEKGPREGLFHGSLTDCPPAETRITYFIGSSPPKVKTESDIAWAAGPEPLRAWGEADAGARGLQRLEGACGWDSPRLALGLGRGSLGEKRSPPGGASPEKMPERPGPPPLGRYLFSDSSGFRACWIRWVIGSRPQRLRRGPRGENTGFARQTQAYASVCRGTTR